MRILVISLAGIGDTLFATPLIHELRANFPDATIDALVMWAGSRDLLAHNPHLNTVHQKNLLTAGRLGTLKYLAALRRQGYDISLNTHPQSRIHYRIAARVIGAPLRLSHEYECFGLPDRLLVNRTVPQDYFRHAVDNNLAFLPLLGAKPLLPVHTPELYLTASDETWAVDFIARNQLAGHKILGLHVGSGGTKNLALRRWPLANYLELIRWLRRAQPNTRIIFFGGPEEQADHEHIRTTLGPDQLHFPATTSLPQAAALLKYCDTFLSVDTALMHLAATMRVRRQIVIETPTWNTPIEPCGNPFTLVKNPAVGGRGLDFYRYDGPIKGTPAELTACMAAVKVDDVFTAITAG